MGEVVQFIPKRDLERARLIQEARAIYESIFPSETPHCNNRALGTVSPMEGDRIALITVNKD